MKSELAYRPDIDGLRTIAVFSVILCHCGVAGFLGGYVGVDVFFVISGYLITSIILRDLSLNRFSIGAFYRRRARRILPVFVVVVLVCAVSAYRWMLPQDLLGFGKSAVAASLFSSNVLFWLEGGGYFAAPSEFKPLLHTWSLSIEEQFYVVFPLALKLVHRLRPRLVGPAIGLVLVGSLAVSVWATGVREFAFYLLPSRAWELMVGALIASSLNGFKARWLRNLSGLVGLGLIMFSVVMYSQRTLFPGSAAIVPCFGAALIIAAGLRGEHWVGRVLSTPPMVWGGKISYSLYLWHWPLLVFAKYYAAHALTSAQTAAVIAVTVAVSALSWRFVESPFRRAPAKDGSWRVLVLAALALLGSSAVGAVLVLGGGFPQRVPARVRRLALASESHDRPDRTCIQQVVRGTEGTPACRIGAAGGEPTFAVWGDSHAGALRQALSQSAEAAGRSGLLLSMAGCPPLVDALVKNGRDINDECQRFARGALRVLETSSALRRVALVSRWSVYVGGQVGGEEGPLVGGMLLQDPTGRKLDDVGRARLLEAALDRTMQVLRARDKHVFIADPIPEVGWDVPSTVARLAWFHDTTSVFGVDDAAYSARNSFVLDALGRLSSRLPGGARLAPENVLCHSGRCDVVLADTILYCDDDHVSREGAALLMPLFAHVISPP